MRATFKLHPTTIALLRSLAAQFGIKQKSLFDFLMADEDALQAIAASLPLDTDIQERRFMMAQSYFAILEITSNATPDIDKGVPSRSGRMQNMTLEVPLTSEQSRRGGAARIMVPARAPCSTCGGYGHIGYYDCHRCAGEWLITGEVPISVSFPPGLSKDHSAIIPLDRLGIRNLYFTVQFRIADNF